MPKPKDIRKIEIHLEDLSDAFHIELNNEFRKEFFKQIKKKGGYREISKIIGISSSQYYHIKNGRYAIKAPRLMKLIELAEIPLEEVEGNIKQIKSNRGAIAKLHLPIKPKPELASLLGHCFGDGSITAGKREFHYANTDSSLVTNVRYEVKKVFGSEAISDKVDRLTFSTLIGELLIYFGAPSGDKLKSMKDLPEWIIHGDYEIKRCFLRALFDDDGSVMIAEKYPSKNINLHLARYLDNKKTLFELLKSIKNLLEGLGISVLGPYLRGIYSKRGGKRAVAYIMISDRENMKLFLEEVGFSHQAKSKKLNRIIGKTYEYTKVGHELELKHMQRLIGEENGMSTIEVAKRYNITKVAAYKRLRQLESKGKISRQKIRSNLVLWCSKLSNGGDNID